MNHHFRILFFRMADDWATAVDVQEGINRMKVQPPPPTNEQPNTAQVELDPFTDEGM